jgi:hypothetical protein
LRLRKGQREKRGKQSRQCKAVAYPFARSFHPTVPPWFRFGPQTSLRSAANFALG